jgi:hypothetical protein
MHSASISLLSSAKVKNMWISTSTSCSVMPNVVIITWYICHAWHMNTFQDILFALFGRSVITIMILLPNTTFCSNLI